MPNLPWKRTINNSKDLRERSFKHFLLVNICISINNKKLNNNLKIFILVFKEKSIIIIDKSFIFFNIYEKKKKDNFNIFLIRTSTKSIYQFNMYIVIIILILSTLQVCLCNLIFSNHVNNTTPTRDSISISSIQQSLRYGFEQIINLQVWFIQGFTHTK